MEQFAKCGRIPESFKVVTTSHVSGPQNAARGELAAFTTLLKTLEEFGRLQQSHVVYTDASYVMGIPSKWSSYRVENKRHKTQNMDLIQEVERLHSEEKHHTNKIKAHQSINLQDNLMDSWLKLGNFVADEAAKASLSKEDPGVIELIVYTNCEP